MSTFYGAFAFVAFLFLLGMGASVFVAAVFGKPFKPKDEDGS